MKFPFRCSYKLGICLIACLFTPSEAGTQPTEQTRTTPPIAQRQGTRTYTLTQLITGLSWLHPERPVQGNEIESSLARFRVTEHGKPVPWEPVDIAVTDSEGKPWNRALLWGGRGHKRRGAESVYHFKLYSKDHPFAEPTVGPALGLWKLRVEFSRKAGFDSQELWTVRNIPVPKRGQQSDYKVIASTVREGVKINLYELDPPGKNYHNYIAWSETPLVSVALSLRLEGTRLDLVKVRDDRNRIVKPRPIDEGSDNDVVGRIDPTYCYNFSVDGIAPDARTVDLTFALHKSVFVEFVARPTRARLPSTTR